MDLRRRDLLLATGLTLIFGRAAHARILTDTPYVFPPRSIARRLSLRNAHTGETFDGPYRDEIGPIPSAMVDLAIFLRDHRENVSGPVFVETLDFLADVIQSAGQARATVLSAYRTEKTNRMLASRIFGVAEKSQHLAGRAMDITLDSNLAPAAKVARKLSRGGVGWYPTNHFIHLDSGPVRSWTIDATMKRDRNGRVFDVFQPARIAESGKAIKRPLSVKERLQLQRAVAKRQAKTGR
ncbi:MAG: DUF882 domain-containing protein [Alphaproteobacteria bacterium]|nr:DUF882 domain-containing protein [Alphaproteobacteria bacterium]